MGHYQDGFDRTIVALEADLATELTDLVNAWHEKAVAIDRFGGPETMRLRTLPVPEVVAHRADPAPGRAGDEHVAHLQGPALHEDADDRATPWVELGNTADNTKLIKDCLDVLALRFNDPAVVIDTREWHSNVASADAAILHVYGLANDSWRAITSPRARSSAPASSSPCRRMATGTL